MKTLKAAALALALAGACLSMPAFADDLSSRAASKVVKAMEEVARKAGRDALASPEAASADAKAMKVLKKHGYSAAEWQDQYGRVLTAYQQLQANPALLAAAEAEEEEEEGGGLFGGLLSADNLSSIGSSAVFGGGDALEDAAKRIAIDEAAKAAGNAMGDKGGTVAAIGSAAAHGGMDAAKTAGTQMAIDGAANAVADMAAGTAATGSGVAGVSGDVAAVAPHHNRIRKVLGG